MLIWLYAEAESIRTESFAVRVRFTTTSPDVAVRVQPGSGWEGIVQVEAKGGTAAIAQLRDVLQKGVSLEPGVGSMPRATGTHRIDLLEALREAEMTSLRGVALTNVEPRETSVEVVLLEEHDVPVSVPAVAGIEFTVEEIDPPRATLWAPSDATLEASATAVARLEASMLAGLEPGRSHTLASVPLVVPSSLGPTWAWRVRPETCRVRLHVRARTGSKTLPTVPVQLVLAPTELDRWRVVIPEEDWQIRDVVVTGPMELLDRVGRDRESLHRVVAVVQLSFEELERGVESKEAELIVLPPPNAPLTLQAPSRTVRLRITPREAGPASRSPTGPP